MDECIVAVIEGFKAIYVFHKNGRYFKDEEDINDLCMAESETWINIYYSKVQDKIWNSVKYNSEKEAKENIVTTISSYLTTAQIL